MPKEDSACTDPVQSLFRQSRPSLENHNASNLHKTVKHPKIGEKKNLPLPGSGFISKLRNRRTFQLFCLVPTTRLELVQLSPLPPQDSVSTNSTTSASNQDSDISMTKVKLSAQNSPKHLKKHVLRHIPHKQRQIDKARH